MHVYASAACEGRRGFSHHYLTPAVDVYPLARTADTLAREIVERAGSGRLRHGANRQRRVVGAELRVEVGQAVGNPALPALQRIEL